MRKNHGATPSKKSSTMKLRILQSLTPLFHLLAVSYISLVLREVFFLSISLISREIAKNSHSQIVENHI